MITRHSSRHGSLHNFLKDRLAGAESYIRIAGYFRSSIFDLVFEDIERIPNVDIICNSELDEADIRDAKKANDPHLAAALVSKWNEQGTRISAHEDKEKWSRLYHLLKAGNVRVHVVSRQDAPFLHGKAGLITYPDGRTTSFVGSINETANGWRHSYELAWEDDGADAAAWVRAEYKWLLSRSRPLSEAVIEEVGRTSQRVEVTLETLRDDPLALIKGVTVESPLVASGQTLAPWQKAFVKIYAEHRETYGCARILLADEVGVGKTLSMAATCLLSVLMDDGPGLILCPSTLTWQWQTELWDKLRIPTSVWGRSPKGWYDHQGHVSRENGPEGILRCPTRIGIVSTGMFVADTAEARLLLQNGARRGGGMFGNISFDEGHKASINRGIAGDERNETNLYKAIKILAERTKNLVIGTATPIQKRSVEIWDLLQVLARGNDHVLGRKAAQSWWAPEESLRLIKGEIDFSDPGMMWDRVRNPLPPASEGQLFDDIRRDLHVADDRFFSSQPLSDLGWMTDGDFRDAVTKGGFLREQNPLVRHTVLRRRKTLEDKGLMPKIAVIIHPNDETPKGYFDGRAIPTTHVYDQAYAQVEKFKDAMKARDKKTGFIGKLMLQRICSSYVAGYNTAKAMVDRRREQLATTQALDTSIIDERDDPELFDEIDRIGQKEFMAAIAHEMGELEQVVDILRDHLDEDPKADIVDFFLDRQGWLQKGCIVFSQYYDTVRWLAEQVSRKHPEEIVTVYAGLGRSGELRNGEWRTVDREDIKQAVKDRIVRLVFATDAACEGLNLQTLGTLINVDLPWNPSRLEQRIGRIKRYGQKLDEVDMANLVYAGTIEQRRYEVLSARMKDRYDILGSIPDTLDDDWIDDLEEMERKFDDYTNGKPASAADQFTLRYGDFLEDQDGDWELWHKVVARPDVEKELLKPW